MCLIGRLGLLLMIPLLMDSCLLFKHEDLGAKSVTRVEQKVDSLTSPEVIGNASRVAATAAVEGLSSDASEEELKRISKVLAQHVGDELDKVFRRLDTRTPGVKFAKGITDSLINKQLEQDLLGVLNSAIKTADGNLNEAVNHLESNLTASITNLASTLDKNAYVLEKVLLETLSDRLQDSLSLFVTDALDKVELRTLSNHISQDLLSRPFRDTLSEIVLEIKEKLSFESEVELWYKVLRENFVQAALFIAALVLVTSYMRNTIQYMDRKDSLKEILAHDPKLKKEFEELIQQAIKKEDEA